MKSLFTATAVCFSLLALSPLASADPSDDHKNGIFSLISDLKSRIENLENQQPVPETVYNYLDYVASPTVSTRTYDYYDTSLSISQGCRTETQQLTRIPNADGSRTILVERHRFNELSGTTCNLRTYDYTATSDAFLINGYSQSNYSVAHKTPIPIRKSAMKVGDSWQEVTGTTRTGNVTGHTFRETTFSAVEDVSTPYQNFSACLKMTTKQLSVYAPSYDAIAWYCKDVGLVKRMLVFNDGTRSLRIKLTGIN